jgi:hypothetical protein
MSDAPAVFKIHPPDYQCDSCSAIFVPLEPHYPCPRCATPSVVEQLMTQRRVPVDDIIAVVHGWEEEWKKKYPIKGEFPNFILEVTENMRRNKKINGLFFKPVRCGTGLCLGVDELKSGGRVEAFMENKIIQFYDFFEKNGKEVGETVDEYFENGDEEYEEFDYLKKNIIDAIYKIYEIYKKDSEMNKIVYTPNNDPPII